MKKRCSGGSKYPTKGDILMDQSFQWFRNVLQNKAPISDHQIYLNALLKVIPDYQQYKKYWNSMPHNTFSAHPATL